MCLPFSSGNHAQAVAPAARLHNCKATILMPADAPQMKLDATRGYGAEVITTIAIVRIALRWQSS